MMDGLYYLLKVCLKGTPEALQTAYRKSIKMLAEFDMEYGPESQPDNLEFRWEWIQGYRVLTVKTDGAAIAADFSNIPGIEECLWVLHNTTAAIAQSNDAEGIILNRKETFGIPEDEYGYEIISDGTPEADGDMSFDPSNPDVINID